MGQILNIGDKIDGGRLTVMDEITTGHFSEVYIVMKEIHIQNILKINLPHALIDRRKVSPAAYARSKQEDHESRTQNEVKILLKFNHWAIARIEDVIDIDGGYQGILFQHIPEAKTLQSVIEELREYGEHKRTRKTDDDRRIDADMTERRFRAAAKPTWDLGAALDECAEKRVVHRDIRPGNIILDRFNHAHLIDFGFACELPEDEHHADSAIMEPVWGSRTYAPPEIYYRPAEFDSDKWSLGAVLYELLTGEHILDNSPNPDEKRIKAIEKAKALYQGDNALKFYNTLRDKFQKLEGIARSNQYLYWEERAQAITCMALIARYCSPHFFLRDRGGSYYCGIMRVDPFCAPVKEIDDALKELERIPGVTRMTADEAYKFICDREGKLEQEALENL